ncbi:MAG: hypothetical protein ETSY1_03760 [Candidatus Entotheonella factor]|uniref:ParB/Sulfiredoxin domain-containing protein n=1 Tax=Entotheonella factor TaxID=1429438 RepID=W4LWW8_ENTF1|nr:MAG: hypothetical protein ETSY1_03760 [Candidatus Entotheonella factor]
MAEFARVDVKEIESHVPRSNFSEDEIERLADLILQCGGILRPLIVKQEDIDKFILLDGFREYYSAVRAREKNPRHGELVNSFVIAPKDDIEIVHQQITLLRGGQPEVISVATIPSSSSTMQCTTSKHPDISSTWISSFETRLSDTREESFQANRELEIRVSKLEKRLEAKQHHDLLEFINSADKLGLINKLISLNGTTSNKLEAIYEARLQKENGQFIGYQDLEKSTKNLGASGLLSLIDNWRRINSQ